MSAMRRLKVYEQWACGGGMPLDDFEGLHAGMGTVLLTVAEHDDLLRGCKGAVQRELRHEQRAEREAEQARRYRSESDSLRAEVERLAWNLAGCLTYAESRTAGEPHAQYMAMPALEAVRALVIDYERLRKGREDDRNTVGVSSVAEDRAVSSDVPRSDMGACLLAVSGEALDPRLGTQQPEGEPVGPRPMRRWVPIL